MTPNQILVINKAKDKIKKQELNMYYSYLHLSKTATIYLKVKANSKESQIGSFIHINDKFLLKIMIGEIAENGKANIAIIKMLAKIWNLKQDQLEIIKGHNRPIKLLAIKNVTESQIEELIQNVRPIGI
jgi:uncharacterized protein YggU (UPF0235/DUF167 family)